MSKKKKKKKNNKPKTRYKDEVFDRIHEFIFKMISADFMHLPVYMWITWWIMEDQHKQSTKAVNKHV